MNLNKVMLAGAVGKNPEIREVNGAKCATFTLATNERFKDKNGEYQTLTEWHNIVCWRGTAEFVEKYITKGSQVYVEGKIRTRSWEKDGEKKYVVEIIASDLQPIGKREQSQAPAPQTQQRPKSTPLPDAGEDDDFDLPF